MLSKNIREPYLGWIVNGRKTFEGRLKWKDWEKVSIGDQIEFWSDQHKCTVCVDKLRYFDDFGDAFNCLGYSLIPEGAESGNEAKEFYKGLFNDDDVKKYGVVCLGFYVVKWSRIF
jgi:ASC-1-like (ASCH) protein